ncbi:Signal transduction histidine kinase [Friedmanniella luteola]|uniref:histidine kinase n=1 Tax=Friedmanniella luteola TaxID=546871 RepID=A0A1H1RH73_9ACTN|nr:HAMP domain-containing sensor histidine kinase [Friedmanniella luteola]SDS35101.1 Signal transduction histidine kinase [Friedmanniella luteola]
MLDVLAGQAIATVAQQRDVDLALLRRWTEDFLAAGTAQVTNQPDADAAHQRDRFLAAFAHEMRTPLATATGWASMLRSGALPPSALPSVLDKLGAALDRLTERTLDVELLASCSLGRLTLTQQLTTISTLTGHLTGLPVISGAGATTQVWVDPDRFSRILRDLWDAANSLPVPRARSLHVHPTAGGWMEFRVVRDADPISPDILQALFDPFDANHDGTGVTIGLYLARALTVAHGGTLGVDQDDQHATFWVRIPHHPTHPTTAHPFTTPDLNEETR